MWFSILKKRGKFEEPKANNEDAIKEAGAVVSTTPGVHNLRFGRKKDGREEDDD